MTYSAAEDNNVMLPAESQLFDDGLAKSTGSSGHGDDTHFDSEYWKKKRFGVVKIDVRNEMVLLR